MASVTGTLSDDCKERLLNGLPAVAINLRAYKDPDVSLDNVAINLAYGPASSSGGVSTIDLSSGTDIDLTIPTDTTVSRVSMTYLDGSIKEFARVTLSSDNVFPAGGTLNVTSYAISLE